MCLSSVHSLVTRHYDLTAAKKQSLVGFEFQRSNVIERHSNLFLQGTKLVFVK